jgi:glycosyltransferase involved in cell wall biosynthesis
VTAEPGTPLFLSVIVIASERRVYLQTAVSSVLAQDLERSAYEIVVVKGFQDESIDSFLRQARVVTLSLRGSSAQLWVAGVRACRGDVILFLDDDDVFETGKLRAVKEEFEADPTLGYYRNLFRLIGSDGNPLRPEQLRPFGLQTPQSKTRVRLTDVEKESKVGTLAGTFPDFTTSTIALRRPFAEAVLPLLEEIRWMSPTAMLVAALGTEYTILLDPRVLTCYRLHGLNISFGGEATGSERTERLLVDVRRREPEYLSMRRFIANRGRPWLVRELDARLLMNRLTLAFRGDGSRRGDVLRVLAQLTRLTDTFAVRDSSSYLACGVLFAISPALAQSLYYGQLPTH